MRNLTIICTTLTLLSAATIQGVEGIETKKQSSPSIEVDKQVLTSQIAHLNESTLPYTASANGRYSSLIQVLNCPRDNKKYGEFNDYGYWGGGPWCEQTGEAGYWVWVNPNWYVWQNQK